MAKKRVNPATGALKEDTNWWMFYIITIFIVTTSVASGFYQVKKNRADQERYWQRFASEHSCLVTGKKEPTGLSIVGQTGWSCDDGVIYWIDNQKPGTFLTQSRYGKSS